MRCFLSTISFALTLVAVATPSARAETYRLTYDAAVLGVVVLGTASYEVTANQSRYGVRATLQTSGLARLFDQTQISATAAGTITNGTIGWSRYDLSHSYASKFRRIRLDRANGAVASQVTPPYGNMGSPAATPAQQNSSYDPLTAVFALGRQVGAARACQGSVLVFDGRQHYRLAVSPRGQGNFNAGGYNGPALNCTFRYEAVAGFSTNFNRSSIPVADAWFALPAQPGFAAPLRLTVPTPLGAAQLNLTRYEQVG